MADVLIVCVREDEPRAKALAEMFEAAGFSIGGAPSSDGALRSSGAGVVVWSQASIRSRPFLDAAQRVINADKAVVASLIEPPPPSSIGNSPAFDLSDWNGDPNDSALDPLFFAVDRMVNSQRASVGASAAAPEAEYERPATYDAPPSRPRSSTPRSAPPASADTLQSDSEHWRSIRDSRNPADFMDYLARFGPDGAFAEVAELRLKQLTAAAERPAPRTSARIDPGRREAPPIRRELPPTLRRDAPRRADALPSKPPPRSQPMFERPPRTPYERPDLREPAPREGRGAGRAFLLIAVLGGLALAGGLYFGGGLPDFGGGAQHESAPGNAGSNFSDVTAAPPPADAPAENSISDLNASVRAAPLTHPTTLQSPPAPVQRNTPAVATTAPARTGADTRTPPPRTSWTDNSNNAATSHGGGPISLTNTQNQGSTASGPVNLNPQLAQQQPVIVASTAPSPAAMPPAPAVTPSVRFVARPSASRIAELFPERAVRAGVGGRVELNCTVNGTLGLSCGIASESPPGMGFGRAALNASTAYRVDPTLSNGGSAIGSSTHIAVLFQAPAR